jgi:STE24 endopeptidase
MKRFYWFVAIGIILFTCAITLYIVNADLTVSEEERGSPVDPSTFMSDEQLEDAEVLSKIRYILFFIKLPYEWGVYLFILGLGFSSRFQKWAEGGHRWSIIQTFFYLFILSLSITLLILPIDILRYVIGSAYGITTQSIHSWIGDLIKGFWIDLVMTLPMVWVLFYLIKKSPRRWWIYAWILTIPFTLFLYFIQPIVLDPLFNQYKLLDDVSLRDKILDMAKHAEIPAEKVFEVNMSEKTRAMNAYVTGIGSSARIVLWDTTLQKLNEDEVLFVMAHEMAHYVKKHVYWLIGLSLLSMLVFLWLLAKILPWIVSKMGRYWGINRSHDLAVYPIILLLSSVIGFATSPFDHMISRSQEHSADVYALQMTNDPEAMIGAFQKLSAEGLTHPNPPALVKLLLYDHPTLVERIRYAIEYREEKGID